MPRDDDRQELRIANAQSVMGRKDRLVLAGMRLSSKEDRPPACRFLEFGEQRRVIRKRRSVLFEAADHAHIPRAELSKASSNLLVLCETDVERAKDRGGGFSCPSPALERTLRHASIDQSKARSNRLGTENQIGPEIRVDKKADVRTPMR